MSFKPPNHLNLNDNVSNNWTLFKNQFKLFLTATESEKKSDEIKVAQLLSVIGPEALSIFFTFKLGEVSSLKFDDVISAFDKYFSPKSNVVYQRYLFYKRFQGSGEPFNNFLTDLRKLASHCEFGTDEDNMIRDRIVMGINDQSSQEKLLREINLKLEDAVKFCRLVETSRDQVFNIAKDKIASVVDYNYQSSSSSNTTPATNIKTEDIVHSVKQGNHPKHHKFRKFSLKKEASNGKSPSNTPRQNSSVQTQYLCKKCHTTHSPAQCPAYGKTCFLCQKPNHFSVGCFKNRNKPTSVKPKHVNDVLLAYDGDEEFRIDSISNKQDKLAWYQTLCVNGHDVNFKLDSGAEINILPKHVIGDIDPELLDFVVKLK